MKKKVGFFGGSFDPIHLGHLNLAIQIMEAHQLDQIFFCPASQSPHKKQQPLVASKEDRRAMVVAAIAPLPKFTFLDAEIQNHGVSYTVDTIRALKQPLFLILGEDGLQHLHLWKDVEELIALAPPLIGSRAGAALPATLPKAILPAVKKGMMKTTLMEISSTEIRSRLRLGLYCGHLVPAKVWEHINTHKLYMETG